MRSLARASAACAPRRVAVRAAPASPSRLAAPAAGVKAGGGASAFRRLSAVAVASASAEGEPPARARKKHAAPEAPESIARHVEGLASTSAPEAPPGSICLVYETEWARPVVHVATGGDEEDLHVHMKVLTPHDDAVDADEVEDPSAFPKVAVIPRASAAFCIEGDAADHWDNPGRRPFARYEIQSPGAARRSEQRGVSARS